LKGGVDRIVYIEFLNNEKYPKKGADVADTPEAFQDAGYILNDNDLIIDTDTLEKPIIEKIISMFNIKTQIVWTPRGAHFYYKKPQGFKGNKKVCPLGFEVEYKHSKNTKWITVKQQGELRIIENEGIREELPDIFFTRRKLESLLGLDENEGRNSALFAHRMKIHDLAQWQSILRFVNNNIFATPLPEEEFQTISRDVKLEARKDSEPELADYILNKYKAVSYLSKLYWYENEQYINDEDKLKRLVFNEVGLQKTRYIDEIIKQMKYRAPIIEQGTLFDIKLQNGILREGQFIEVDFQEFTPYTIDIPYFEDAERVQIVENYLDQMTSNDNDYKKRLLEILAHPLIVNKDFKRLLAKFFIFVGDGGNGKGTLLYIIRTILGQKNCGALSIKNMTDERYFTTLQNKLVNLGDDVQDEAINNEQMKILKNISTCDFVTTRNLFEQSKDVELTTSLIFTSNHILKSFEKGEAYKRRVDWLPMYTKPEKKDAQFISKITTPEALQYWLKLVVEAYQRLYEQKGFTESKLVTKFNEDYHLLNNNCTEFLNDFDAEHFLGKRAPEAYEEYTIWAEENGLNVHGKKLFHESMKKVHRLEIRKTTKNSRSLRSYAKIKED
jgi:putative DNA primase/helicase